MKEWKRYLTHHTFELNDCFVDAETMELMMVVGFLDYQGMPHLHLYHACFVGRVDKIENCDVGSPVVTVELNGIPVIEGIK